MPYARRWSALLSRYDAARFSAGAIVILLLLRSSLEWMSLTKVGRKSRYGIRRPDGE